MPRLSVILPVYNRADVVDRAIRSVLDQSLRDFELIVVDDASTDGSVAVARSFADRRIRIIELHAHGGGNVARDAGVRAASAPLIGFLDSDDAYLPEKLQRVSAEFERRPELDLLVDSFVKIPETGVPITRKNPVIKDRETFRKALFQRQLWKATPSITVRRHAIVRAGMFDESLGRLQDFDFLARASQFANCASIDEVLWVKYWDARAISAQDNMIPANIELVRRHPEYLHVREYRPGLAYMVRLSLWRRLKKGDPGGILRDIRSLKGALGPREATGLLLEAALPRPKL